jgi:hypothetical protein
LIASHRNRFHGHQIRHCHVVKLAPVMAVPSNCGDEGAGPDPIAHDHRLFGRRGASNNIGVAYRRFSITNKNGANLFGDGAPCRLGPRPEPELTQLTSSGKSLNMGARLHPASRDRCHLRHRDGKLAARHR